MLDVETKVLFSYRLSDDISKIPPADNAYTSTLYLVTAPTVHGSLIQSRARMLQNSRAMKGGIPSSVNIQFYSLKL